MHEYLKAHYDVLGPKVAETLNKNYFEAYYCSKAEDAVEKVLDLIPETDTVAWGGSLTISSLGITEKLKKRGNPLLDRDSCPVEEREECMRKVFFADTYLMSSNAVTQDGHLFNIDGCGNRVAALTFGPKSVIVVAGMNKVVKDKEEAIVRVKTTAAPANARRLQVSTPCCVFGQCSDCRGSNSICKVEVFTKMSSPVNRIKVVLVGDILGL